MKKIKLLLSGVGGSLFPYLLEKLKNKYDLYLIDKNAIVKTIYPSNQIFIVPPVLDDSYEEEILKIINKYEIDFYIPLIDEELMKAINISKKANIKILTPQQKFIKLCLNKYKLMKKLQQYDLSDIPTQLANKLDGSIKYPLFLKPNVGRGSRGIKKIKNKSEFKAYFILEKYAKKNILVQPFINGEEYTVSVTVNNKNKLISIVPKHVFLKEGITKYAKSEKNKLIENICIEIVKKLKPCGSFNVQLKIKGHNIYIFEINPRFSTTLVLSTESGINEIDLCIENYNKTHVDYISDFKEIILIRRWENLFFKEVVENA